MDAIDKCAREACRDPVVRRDHEERIRIAIVTALEARRKKLRMSQATLAKKSGTTHPMLSRLLNGDNRSPRLDTIVKIADALGLYFEPSGVGGDPRSIHLVLALRVREKPPRIVGRACNPSAWMQS